MSDFDFIAPRTLPDALDALGSANGEARVLAGGTDLIDQIRSGSQSVSLLVDVKQIPELEELRVDANGDLRLGAGVTCTDINSNPTIRDSGWSMLLDATRIIGDVKIQNRASLGGNVCNAAPSADGVIPLICLGGRAVLKLGGGSRELLIEDLFQGPGITVLERGEILVTLVLPALPERSAGSYRRITPRAEMDIAFAGVGSWVAVNDDGVVESCRIALSAVAPIPMRARSAEAALAGEKLQDAKITQIADYAASDARPITDHRATAEYRRQMVRELTERTLHDCLTRLNGTKRSEWP